MLGKSRIGLKRLFLHPCFTVGYGSKDHYTMPYYGLVAALYGDGRPVRLANDRFDQFQAGLKRHQFSMGYTAAVERRTGLLQSFRASIVANGGGRANCSVDLTMAGATSAQSVYYFPKSRHRRDRDCITRHRLRRGARLRRAGNLDGDRADGRRDRRRTRPRSHRVPSAQRVQDRNEEHPRRDPARHATRRGGAGEGAGASRCGSAARRASRHTTPHIPGNITGSGSAASSDASAPGRRPLSPRSELAPDGRITLSHTGTEIGTGASSGQAVACVRWLGRPADMLDIGRHRVARPAGGNERRSARDEPSRAGPAGEEPALEPGLCIGLQCQQLVLLLFARDAGGGAHRLSSWAVAGCAGDLGTQRPNAIASGEVRRRALDATDP